MSTNTAVRFVLDLALVGVVATLSTSLAAGANAQIFDVRPVSLEEGASIAASARLLVNEWRTAGFKNKLCPGQYSPTGNYSDCTTFVEQAIKRAGFVIPKGTAYELVLGQLPLLFKKVSTPQLGDVIVQGDHAAIFVGQIQGAPMGANLACKGGPSIGTFGPTGYFAHPETLRFYRLVLPSAERSRVADLVSPRYR